MGHIYIWTYIYYN